VALFGRRKRKEPTVLEPTQSGDLGTVVVPHSAITGETYQVVQAVVNYVNSQIEDGVFRDTELPVKAMQTYHADYYLAQVNNGGHSQFIHNSLQFAEKTWRNADDGLVAMGATTQAELLKEMIVWSMTHPDETKAQTGFTGGRAEPLDKLDDRFYEIQKTDPITDKAAAWIRGWPELQIVEDARYKQVLHETALLNPHREDRIVARGILRVHNQLTDPLHVSAGLAASAAENLEVLLGIGGGSYMTVEGEEVMVWTIQTSTGKRFAHVSEKFARLYECLEKVPMPKIDHNDLEASYAAYKASGYEPATVGARLSDVPSGEVSEVISRAKTLNAAAAVDLLLRNAGLDPEGARVSAIRPEPLTADRPALILLVPLNSTLYHVGLFQTGASLQKFGVKETLSKAPRADIDAHWVRTEV